MQNLTKVTILGREVPIKRCTAKELQTVSKDPDNVGFYDGEAIYIRKSVSPQKYKLILLHELSHAILGITGATSLLDEDEEEVICTSLESFIDLFKDKQLNKFLSE